MDYKISEKKIILLMCLVQFLDIFEFMVVLPMGPDIAFYFNVNQSFLGYNAISYTIAAAISGVLSAKYIDRFERKKVLILGICGIILSNFINVNASSFEHIVIARFFSGIFGGISTAQTFAIIADTTAPNRRGRVIGKVMSAFSLAATLGVPLALEISRLFSWRYSFLFVCLCGVIILLIIIFKLPTLDKHLQHIDSIKEIKFLDFLKNKKYITAYIVSSLGLMAIFMIIPYVSAFLQLNLNFDRSNLGMMYFYGGICSFFTAQLVGHIIDKFGSIRVISIGIIMFSIYVISVFIYNSPYYFILYGIFMSGIAMRNIANSAIMSNISKNHDRAGFMSIISMFQHIFSALGSYFASIIIFQQNFNSPLLNTNILAVTAIAIFSITPIIANKYLCKSNNN
jgi:predicted MFS family arabinose efflux permease